MATNQTKDKFTSSDINFQLESNLHLVAEGSDGCQFSHLLNPESAGRGLRALGPKRTAHDGKVRLELSVAAAGHENS